MTVTQAPTPGPLTSESVKLLVKGDLLWSSDTGRIGRFSDISATKPFCLHIWWSKDTYSPTHPLDGLSFVGRPDADGLMPWSGGENPVPGQRVEVRCRDGIVKRDLSGIFAWSHSSSHSDRHSDITAFRLAPTAPVEASGSERDEIARLIWQRFAPSSDMDEANALRGEYVLVADDIMNLRPQPSGETREALDRLKMAAHVYEDDEMAADCATLEALLSARPLALGGQQGDSETLRVLLDNLVIAQTLSKDIRQKATDEARSYLYDRRHPPARAEAQDEGAAGYKAALIDDLRRYYNDCTPPQMHYAQSDGLAFALDTAIRLLSEAHPSPTPAADADRVLQDLADRVTAEVKRGADGSHVQALGALSNIEGLVLAALKSTAAKEGGK